MRPISQRSQTGACSNTPTANDHANTLILKTVVEAQTPDGKFVPLRSTTWNEPIHVKVGFWYELKQAILSAPFWIKAVTAVITAIAGLIAAWFALTKLFRRP